MRRIRQPEGQRSTAGLDQLAPPGDLENGRLLAWAQHFRHDGEHPSGTVLVMGAPAADPLPYAVWTAYTVDRGGTWTCMQGIYHRSLPVAWEAFTGRASWGVLAIGAGDECGTGTCELGHGCAECPDWPHAGHPDCACIYDGLGGGDDGGGAACWRWRDGRASPANGRAAGPAAAVARAPRAAGRPHGRWVPSGDAKPGTRAPRR